MAAWSTDEDSGGGATWRSAGGSFVGTLRKLLGPPHALAPRLLHQVCACSFASGVCRPSCSILIGRVGHTLSLGPLIAGKCYMWQHGVLHAPYGTPKT